ncbi:actin-binding protein IPP-like isoform X1 [Lingula anatina]|uniref:Actin-binding protein IPP-like isoform X1 n=1 Tax=Lingula anatina TaxID=7574 RepID=A0A1S3JH40_LINAN|nr:actin-binding protein IPP-like isoform X1 [Lingula anatina]|eukprot:XP_013409214.1 actin-binding protein IPP-like isoform X1 [Lingula anatina]
MPRKPRAPAVRTKLELVQVKIGDKNIGNRTLSKLNQLRTREDLCDVKIKVQVDSEVYHAHRCILTVNSDYFRAMFGVEMTESRTNEVVLTGTVESDAVRDVLNYLYTGNLLINAENVQSLFLLSDMWQMAEVINFCTDFMEKQLDVTNCLGVYCLAEKFQQKQLAEKAARLVKQQFTLICREEEFLTVPPEIVERILSWGDIYLGAEASEDEVVRVVWRWTEHDQEHRKQYLKSLLSLVRFSGVSKETLDWFRGLGVIQEDKELQELISTRLSFPYEARRRPGYIYVIGGYLQSRTGPTCPRLKTVERYSTEIREWDPVAPLPETPSHLYALNTRGRIYCIAVMIDMESTMAQEKEARGKCYHFDIVKEVWEDATHCVEENAMQVLVKCFKDGGAITHCQTSDCIYCVTADSCVCIKITDFHGEPEFRISGQWRSVEDYREFHHQGHSAVVLGGKVYMLGGADMETRASVPKPDQVFPSSALYKWELDKGDRWEKMASMREPRSVCAVTVLNGCIYAIGGFSARRLTSVEKYDPVTESWTTVASLNKPRTHCCAVTLDGKIYVMGGKSYSFNQGGARKVLSSVEVYDPVCDTWSYIEQMNQARCWYGAVVL